MEYNEKTNTVMVTHEELVEGITVKFSVRSDNRDGIVFDPEFFDESNDYPIIGFYQFRDGDVPFSEQQIECEMLVTKSGNRYIYVSDSYDLNKALRSSIAYTFRREVLGYMY